MQADRHSHVTQAGKDAEKQDELGQLKRNTGYSSVE
jgi:hypothetical protein